MKSVDPHLNIIKEISADYQIPAELQSNEYRDRAQSKDVVQVFFRYGPFSNGPGDKFGFEIAFGDNPNWPVKKREIRDAFERLESTWKQKFRFVFYNGVPYATKAIHEPSELHIRCELCNKQWSVGPMTKDAFDKKRDLLLCLGLKEIDCDCQTDWDRREINTEADLFVEEVGLLNRI